jgi:hypothetical protein
MCQILALPMRVKLYSISNWFSLACWLQQFEPMVNDAKLGEFALVFCLQWTSLYSFGWGVGSAWGWPLPFDMDLFDGMVKLLRTISNIFQGFVILIGMVFLPCPS